MGDTTPSDICLSHFIRTLQSTQYLKVLNAYSRINPAYGGVTLVYTRVYKTFSYVSYSLSLLSEYVKNENVI